MSHYSPGVGTDIIVRKVGPASSIGEGYYVDIFEGGIKNEEKSTKLKNRKEVNKLIKSYKQKYHTDRAFHNETQFHVTYKTREERGDEKAMNNLDQELIKKADYIQGMIQRLIDPTSPIKIREAGIVDNNVNFIPETQNPTGEPEEPVNPDTVGKELAKEIVTFINENAPEQGEEWLKNDDLYNPIMKWLSAVRKKEKDYKKMTGQGIDIKNSVDKAYDVLFSGKPEMVKSGTGIDVTPEVAEKIKEVCLMTSGKTSKKNKGAVNEIPAPTTPIGLPKAANTNDDINKLVGFVQKKHDENDAQKSIEEFQNSNSGIDVNKIVKKLEELKEGEPKNYAEHSILNTKSQMDDREENLEYESDDIGDMISSRKMYSTNLFWEHAKNLNKVASVENTFEEWIGKTGLSLKVAEKVWDNVRLDISESFGIIKKKAAIVLNSIIHNIGNVIDNIRADRGYNLSDDLNEAFKKMALDFILDASKNTSKNKEGKDVPTPFLRAVALTGSLTGVDNDIKIVMDRDMPRLTSNQKDTINDAIKEIKKLNAKWWKDSVDAAVASGTGRLLRQEIEKNQIELEQPQQQIEEVPQQEIEEELDQEI